MLTDYARYYIIDIKRWIEHDSKANNNKKHSTAIAKESIIRYMLDTNKLSAVDVKAAKRLMR